MTLFVVRVVRIELCQRNAAPIKVDSGKERAGRQNSKHWTPETPPGNLIQSKSALICTVYKVIRDNVGRICLIMSSCKQGALPPI